MGSIEADLHAGREPPAGAEPAPTQRYRQAWAAFADAQTTQAFCSAWLVIQCHAIGEVSDGVVVLLQDGEGSFAPVAFYPDSPRDRSHLARVSERALQTGQGVCEPCDPIDHAAAAQPGPRYQLAYPIRVDGEVRAVVGVEIAWRADAPLQAAMRALQWGSGWLEALLRRHVNTQEAQGLRLKLALDLVCTLLESPGLKPSSAAFATELASRLGCDRVTLGLVDGPRIKTVAVSHSLQFEARANLLRAIGQAMEEAIDQGETVVCPADPAARPLVTLAHAALLRESGAGSAATVVLRHGDGVVGALSFERASGHRFDAPTLELCEAVAAVAGPVIELKHANEASLPVHAGRSVKGLWDRLAGPGHPGWKLGAIGATLLVAFLGFATGDHRVSANAQVEGVVQRAVSAPTSGFVVEAPLRAGDKVRQGQVIARLDDRDLRLELSRLESQRDQYSVQLREATGKRLRAQIAVVGAQIQQAEAQLALVREQLARTALLAPLDGLIVSGDLSQDLGSPVERGQVLFEVAPLDDYRMVLEVDERDIAFVAAGQQGELAVTSMPSQRFGFTLRTITPVNVAKEGGNFFRVEAELEQQGGQRLRPGMKGVGKINIGERKIVWIWTHRFTDWVRQWLWSWTP